MDIELKSSKVFTYKRGRHGVLCSADWIKSPPELNTSISCSIFKSTLLMDGEVAVINAEMKPNVLAV